jgi:fructose-bisphosphate aldolase, class II
MTAVLWKVVAENPGEFDPRRYLGPARDELIKTVRHKNEPVLMSAGKA